MIISGAAPTGASFLALNCAAIAASKITTSQGLGATDLFKVWGSVRATSVGGEPNNFPLGTLSGGTSGLSPILTSAWTTLLFQRVGGAGSGTLYVEGPSWGRSAPVEVAAPTAPAAFSGPLSLSATAPAYLLSLDDAATSGDLYQVWGTNDGTTRTPASAAGATLLGQLRGGGLVPPLLVIGYELVIVQCTAHAAATKVVAVETVNDGFTGLSTSTPPAGWQLGGNAPGGPMVGGSTDGSSVTVQALGGAGTGNVNVTSGPNGAVVVTGGSAPSSFETAGALTVQGAGALNLFSGGIVSVAGTVVAVQSGDTSGDVDVTSPGGDVNVSSTEGDLNLSANGGSVVATGRDVLLTGGSNARLMAGALGTTQIGAGDSRQATQIISDQVGGPEGAAITVKGKLSPAAVPAGDADTGGFLGGLTAAQSVDVAWAFVVDQRTSGQVLLLQNPSNPGPLALALVANAGTASFVMYGITLTPNATPQTSRAWFLWDGTAWGAVQ